jgi:predicted DNA-binding protein with PD1-like motif
MKSRLISNGEEKVFIVVFDTGDDAMQGLLDFARANRVSAGHFTAIGAFSSVVLGYLDWEKKDYERIPLMEQVEVLSLVGDVALENGSPKIHAHIVVGKRDGSAHGGHLLEGHVRPTLEVVLHESHDHLKRKLDPDTGLALIDVGNTT